MTAKHNHHVSRFTCVSRRNMMRNMTETCKQYGTKQNDNINNNSSSDNNNNSNNNNNNNTNENNNNNNSNKFNNELKTQLVNKDPQ